MAPVPDHLPGRALEVLDPRGGKIRYTLEERPTAGGHELWGMVDAGFGAALLSLKRAR